MSCFIFLGNKWSVHHIWVPPDRGPKRNRGKLWAWWGVINCPHPHKFLFCGGVTHSPLTINFPILSYQTQQENLENFRQPGSLKLPVLYKNRLLWVMYAWKQTQTHFQWWPKEVGHYLCSFWEVFFTQIFACVLLWHVYMSTCTWVCVQAYVHACVCVYVFRCACPWMCTSRCGSLRLMSGAFIICSQPYSLRQGLSTEMRDYWHSVSG